MSNRPTIETQILQLRSECALRTYERLEAAVRDETAAAQTEVRQIDVQPQSHQQLVRRVPVTVQHQLPQPAGEEAGKQLMFLTSDWKGRVNAWENRRKWAKYPCCTEVGSNSEPSHESVNFSWSQN